MGWIRLSDEDTKRYGAPADGFPFSYSRFGLKAIDAMESQIRDDAGEPYTMESLSNDLRRPLLDGDGKPVMVPEIGEDDTPVLEGGEPKLTEAISPRPRGVAVVVWLALWSNGIRMAWDDFEVSQIGLQVDWADRDETGKAEAPPTGQD